MRGCLVSEFKNSFYLVGMHTVIRCILLVVGFFAGVAGSAQKARIDTFVLHFAFDRSEIRPADTAALRLFIRDQLRAAGDSASSPDIDSIGITGHTDTVGTPEYNQRLSLRRAMAAATVFRRWLREDSILITRIEARGEGEPLGGDSESRRVAIVCWHRPPPPPAPIVEQRDTPRDLSEPDTILLLDDIRFYANTTNLTESARVLLPRHIDYLLTLKDHYLEIDGYCNSPGPPLKATDPLYILSIRRARFIYDRLVEQGFDPGRLTYQGKGNTNPRSAHPKTREEMDKNMRVEIKVFRRRPEP
jgi:outer membrane protein OmpA-like peptidoglycan-associated protein